MRATSKRCWVFHGGPRRIGHTAAALAVGLILLGAGQEAVAQLRSNGSALYNQRGAWSGGPQRRLRRVRRPLDATRFKAFTYTTKRTHHTSDSPDRARRVVANMKVSDGANAIPPLVSVSKTGPGSFRASGPGMSVTAKVTVSPGRGGGSTITERVKASSLCPAAAVGAATYHNTVGTSLSAAYNKARDRTR